MLVASGDQSGEVSTPTAWVSRTGSAALDGNSVDVEVGGAGGGERDPVAPGGPVGLDVGAGMVGEASFDEGVQVDDVDVGVAVAQGVEGDPPTVGRPAGMEVFAGRGSEPTGVEAVGVHEPEVEMAVHVLGVGDGLAVGAEGGCHFVAAHVGDFQQAVAASAYLVDIQVSAQIALKDDEVVG